MTSIFFSLKSWTTLNNIHVKVQLPTLVAHTNMDQDAVNILKDHFAQILVFLQKNQHDLFLKEYEIATPTYMAKVE